VWIAPEDPVKSYAPDNAPVAIEVQGDAIVCTGPVEALTGMEKKITVKTAATGTAVELIHALRNAGAEPYHLAPWILTMFAQGGAGIHGFPPRGAHPESQRSRSGLLNAVLNAGLPLRGSVLNVI
jgi:hypothetical protein